MPQGSSLGLTGLEGIGSRATVQMEQREVVDQDPLRGKGTGSVAACQPASQELRRPVFILERPPLLWQRAWRI